MADSTGVHNYIGMGLNQGAGGGDTGVCTLFSLSE